MINIKIVKKRLSLEESYFFPHCDPTVLHAPGECEYCDKLPTLQKTRINLNINFTGERDPRKNPDPSEIRRPLDTINRWPGNRPAGY